MEWLPAHWTSAGVTWSALRILQSFVIPDLKAVLVKPHLAPIMHNADGHPPIQHDRGAAPVAVVAGPRPERQLNRVAIRKATVPEPSLDELTNESGMHVTPMMAM